MLILHRFLVILICACALLTGCSSTPSAPAPTPKKIEKQKDVIIPTPPPPPYAKLLGNWDVVASESEGVAPSEKELRDMSFTMAFTKTTYLITSGKKGPIQQGILKNVNVNVTPHQIDLIANSGPEKDKPQLGIFKVEESTLTICLGKPGVPRPKSFTSPVGSGLAIMVLNRQSSNN